jgi:ribosomal protein S18 acetylase RimI-like enzyme
VPTPTDTIRKATITDLPAIITLENKCFPNPLAYTPRQLHYLLTKANSTVLIHTHDNTLRGFIIILYHAGSTTAGIETIDVDPTYRHQGIGHRLLTAAENDMHTHHITRVRLEVSTQNTPAIALYQRAGYQTTELLSNYYTYSHQDSRDAFRMVKDLS